MKTIKSLLVLLLTICSMSTYAYDFYVDGIYYNVTSVSDLTCSVTFKECKNTNFIDYAKASYFGDVVIPATVTLNGKVYTVTSIDSYAFNNSTDLTSVVLPNTITTIGDFAFCMCGATTINIPKSVTKIGIYAFFYCSVTSLVIPDSVTDIGDFTFRGSNVQSVVIGNSITSIGNQMFYGCSNLKSLVIGKSVASIETNALFGCTLLKDVTILNTTPPYADSYYYSTEYDLKVPNEAVSAYQAHPFWSIYNIVGIDASIYDPKPCTAPEIYIEDGRLIVTSETETAECSTTITSEDCKTFTGNESIELTGVYTISAFAYADGYENSETVYATLVWVAPEIEGGIETGALSMEAKKAVVIKVVDNQIVVCGTESGERVELYTIDGVELCSVLAQEHETSLPCNAAKGTVVVVKYGGKAIKLTI